MITYFGILVASLIAFVGVLIPVLTNFYQNRILKLEKNTLKQEIIEESKSEIKKHFDSFKVQSEKNLILMDIEFKRKTKAIEGLSFHIMGMNQFKNELYVDSLKSYMTASAQYLEGGDNINLQRVNDNIVKLSLKKISHSDFESSPDLEEKMKNLINLYEEKDDKNIYTNIIEKMKREFNEAKKRKLPVKTK